MVKSGNRGNAEIEAILAGSGTMAAPAGDAAGDGPGPGPRRAAAEGPADRVPLRQLMDDRLLDALLDRSRDEAGGLRLTGEGSMLGELVKAVLERALEAELTAHLGYERGDRAGRRRPRTTATAPSPRRCRPASGRCRWPCRGTGPARSSRCWCPSGPGGSPAAWTT